MSVGYGILGLGMIAAGPLTNAFGARAVWIVAAALFALAAGVGLVLVRGVAEEVDRPAAEAQAPPEPAYGVEERAL